MKKIISIFSVSIMCVSFAWSAVDGATGLFDTNDRNVYRNMLPEVIEKGKVFLEHIFLEDVRNGTLKLTTQATFDQLRNIICDGRREIAVECAKSKTAAEKAEALLFGKSRIGIEVGFKTTLTRRENGELYEIFLKMMTDKFGKIRSGKKCSSFQIKSFEDFHFEVLPGGLQRALDQDTEALFELLGFNSFTGYPCGEMRSNLAHGTLTFFRLTQQIKINGRILPSCFIYALSNRTRQSAEMRFQSLDFLKRAPNFCIVHSLQSDVSTFMNVVYDDWVSIVGFNVDNLELIGDLHNTIADLYWFHSIAAPDLRGSEAELRMLLDITMAYKNMKLAYNEDFVFRMPFAMQRGDFCSYFKEKTTINLLNKEDSIDVRPSTNIPEIIIAESYDDVLVPQEKHPIDLLNNDAPSANISAMITAKSFDKISASAEDIRKGS